MKKIIYFICFGAALLTILGILNFGIKDGLRFNFTAFTTAVTNRTASDEIPGNLPVYDIEVEESLWKKLISDLPLSGKQKVQAKFIKDGISYPIAIKTRGYLPLHWKGPKKSVRIQFMGNSPFFGINKINFVNPKFKEMLGNHISMWIGQKMGLNTVKDSMVFLRINGINYGLMELIEQPTDKYEIARNIGANSVPVYKGDQIPIGDTTMVSEFLWESSLNWDFKGKADRSISDIKLEKLVEIINLEKPHSDKWDDITKCIDIDEYIKYYAGLRIINTVHIDQTHNQVIVFNPRKEKFYPILWDPMFMWETYYPENNSYYMIYDALTRIILSNPTWRAQRDEHIFNFVKDYYLSGSLYDSIHNIKDNVSDAVYLDHNKCAPVTSYMRDVYRFSNIDFELSTSKMIAKSKNHYNKMVDAINYIDLEYIINADKLILEYTTNSPIIIEVTLDKEKIIDEKSIFLKNTQYDILAIENNKIKIKMYGAIKHIDGENAPLYGSFRSYLKCSNTLEFKFNSSIKSIQAFNGITGKEITLPK